MTSASDAYDEKKKMKSVDLAKALSSMVAFLACAPAAAQIVVQADRALLQPQIQRDADGFRSCGVRAVVLHTTGIIVDAYDFSLVVDAKSAVGMMKAGKSVIKTADLLKGKYASTIVLPAPVNFWITAETDGKVVEPKKFYPSETKGFVLALSDLVPTFKAVVDIMTGERMQFAVRYKSQSLNTVVSFAGEMSDVERKPLFACLEGVRERIAKEVSDRAMDQ